MYSVCIQCTVYSLRCKITVCFIQCTVYNVQCSAYVVQCTDHSLRCTVCCARPAFCTEYSTVHINIIESRTLSASLYSPANVGRRPCFDCVFVRDKSGALSISKLIRSRLIQGGVHPRLTLVIIRLKS